MGTTEQFLEGGKAPRGALWNDFWGISTSGCSLFLALVFGCLVTKMLCVAAQSDQASSPGCQELTRRNKGQHSCSACTASEVLPELWDC